MCGVGCVLVARPLGAHGAGASAVPESWLAALDRAVEHRGPDGSGRWRAREERPGGVIELGMTHRRLSVIDHAGGAQPMVLRRGERRIAVVFNGCIYNHRALRLELRTAHGCAFATDHSDTEVLLHGWAAWGDGMWDRLDGMFAVALWDSDSAELVLARDRAGEKPLLWWMGEDRSAASVSSTASGLMALAAQAREARGREVWPDSVDDAALRRWVEFGWWPVMPIRGMRSVRPGGWVRIGAGTGGATLAVCEGMWRTLPARATKTVERQAGGAERLGAALDAAVASRLEADVPLGCLLSGGVDSALVAEAAVRLGGGTLRTFTVRMPEAVYDESPQAEATAAAIGSTHTTLQCAGDPAVDLRALIERLGLPLGDSSLLPTHWACRAAREHVKVLLTGDGGDELFGGYERYRAARWIASAGVRRALARMPGGVARAMGRAHPRSALSKLGRLASASAGDGYAELLRLFPNGTARWRGEGDGSVDVRGWGADPMRADFEHYLPEDLLRKVDAASMACAVEARCPLLAREVVDIGLGMPVDVLLKGGAGKAPLRALARARLGAGIGEAVARGRKRGFAIPVSGWLRDGSRGLGALAGDLLLSADPWPGIEAPLERGAARELFEAHRAGRAEHGHRVFGLVVLGLWCRWRVGLRREGELGA